ncbi:hypothetical protein TNCV_1825301 [Trichonephila clavipes]|nr:hypothetical protein TNCV_1825301 [Trichonephila clavipes]
MTFCESEYDLHYAPSPIVSSGLQFIIASIFIMFSNLKAIKYQDKVERSESIQPRIQDLIPIALCVYSTRIKYIQWCSQYYAQYLAATLKDSFATKSADFCYVEWMKASFIISPGQDSTRMILSRTFRLTTEKNPPAIMWCPLTNLFSSKISGISCWMGHPGLTPGVKYSFCKMAVYGFREILTDTHQEGHDQGQELLFEDAIVRLMPNRHPVSMSIICGYIG